MLARMSTNEPPTGPDPETPDGPVPPPPPPPPSYGGTSYPPPPPGDASGGGYPPPPGGPSGYGAGGYPPPPPGGSGFIEPFSPTDAIGYGWRKFSANAGQWIIAGLAIFAVSVIFGLFSFLVQPDIDANETNPFAGFNFASIVVNLLSTLATYVISAFIYRGALDETEGRPFSLADTFSRVPVGPVILTSLLVSIGITIGLVLCVLPGIIFAFLSYFALLFVVDENQSPVDAITSSVKLVSANLGQALLLALLSFVIVLIGACLCGLGLLVAYPVVTIATAYAYKKFRDQPVAA
ncbi:Uncharacterized membrane protein [Aeromicrobium choanae]|uniref:Uncharacterized membrane protein n=2 Tax=Aeromicrobium choanae TaxID=1736691 RepID=A0A1T4Z6Y2_9ACTN|nr:Uncharacterized membrane protein [Aeromicrobium choanae]